MLFLLQALLFNCDLHDVSHHLHFRFEFHTNFNSVVPFSTNFLESFAIKVDELLISLLFLILELQLLVLVEKKHECCFEVARVIVKNFVVVIQVVDEVSNEEKIVGFEG